MIRRMLHFMLIRGSELICVTEGYCSIDVKNETFEGGEGTLFVMPAGHPHNQRNRGFTRTNFICFACQNTLFDDSPRKLALTGKKERWVGMWLDQLCELNETAVSDSFSDLAEGILNSIVRLLLQIEPARTGIRQVHPAVALAKRFIEEHFIKTLTLETIAYQANISPSYLMALFHLQIGLAPLKYQQNLRMSYAQRLLRNPYITVKEAGRQCGYEDANYFARLFGRQFHHSPAFYRRNYQTLTLTQA